MAQWAAGFGNLAQWVGVVATTVAIIVALFKESLIRQFRHPALIIKIEAKEPYMVKTPLRHNEWRGSRYFIRLSIENLGKVRADKVEVFLSEVLIQQNASYKRISNFMPMNLRWSYSTHERPDIYADGISPKMGRFCDLAAISDPTHPDLQPLSDTRLALWTETISNITEWLRPGRYKFKVIVAASNSDPKAYWIDLHLTCLWNDDPITMMSNGVVLNLSED